jgi:hypothetical protein
MQALSVLLRPSSPDSGGDSQRPLSAMEPTQACTDRMMARTSALHKAHCTL